MKKKHCSRRPKRTLVLRFLATLSCMKHCVYSAGGLEDTRPRWWGCVSPRPCLGSQSGSIFISPKVGETRVGTSEVPNIYLGGVGNSGWREVGLPASGPFLLSALTSVWVICRVWEVAIFLQEMKPQPHSSQSQPGTCLKFPKHFQINIRKEDSLVVDQKTLHFLMPKGIASWVSKK